ncbi:MAG TPA: tocopherol cyclase family protein [Kofleriaceae bacterium]
MSEADNARVWPADRRGTYEVWYTTWNDPVSGDGYWLRYLIEQPLEGDARGELWFARFDPARPARTFGIHRHFAIGAVASDGARLRIGAAEFAHDHAKGSLAGDGHDVRWDLRWEPAAKTLRHLPDVMYARGGLGETTVHSPNPRVPLSGTLVIDGERVVFDRAIAGQSHVWGKKHGYSWTWGRCAEFQGSDALLELLAVRLQRRGRVLPPLALVALDWEGESHRFTQFRHTIANRATWRVGETAFSAWSPRLRIEGTLTCTPEQMVNAPYLDPDGTEVFCANTEIGDAKLVIYRRRGLGWQEAATLVGPGRAHFEIGGRAADPSVRAQHVLVA